LLSVVKKCCKGIAQKEPPPMLREDPEDPEEPEELELWRWVRVTFLYRNISLQTVSCMLPCFT
jgi:hypothetical protein